jgi:hypothetical protein
MSTHNDHDDTMDAGPHYDLRVHYNTATTAAITTSVGDASKTTLTSMSAVIATENYKPMSNQRSIQKMSKHNDDDETTDVGGHLSPAQCYNNNYMHIYHRRRLKHCYSKYKCSRNNEYANGATQEPQQ